MTSEKLDEITSKIRETFMNSAELVIDAGNEGSPVVFQLLEIIASLHNELYKEATGKYYNYMWHWSNLGCGGWLVDDEMFKDKKEGTTK